MKSHFVALAIVFAGLPALAWGQAPCGCSPRSGSVVRPAAYGAWAEYQPAGHYDGGGCNSCGSCAPACCDPCCRPLLCIIPNTIRKIGRTLDCLLPCGPRSGHGCGITCIGAGSGCSSISCSGGCPSCSSPAMGNPFQDDEPLPMPKPPKPQVQETRRQPSMKATRQIAVTSTADGRMTNTRAATKSVLTRTAKPAEVDVSRANHVAPAAKKSSFVVKRTSATVPVSESTTQSARPSAAIPHNPLR